MANCLEETNAPFTRRVAQAGELRQLPICIVGELFENRFDAARNFVLIRVIKRQITLGLPKETMVGRELLQGFKCIYCRGPIVARETGLNDVSVIIQLCLRHSMSSIMLACVVGMSIIPRGPLDA